jgi:hypothetical protein
MSATKLNLTIKLPGSIMFSREEALKQPTELMEFGQIQVPLKNGQTETIHYGIPKCIPAIQVIHLSSEAYEYMRSDNCPSFVRPTRWAMLSKKDRLEMHLKRISDAKGGISFGYTVLDD